MSASSAVVRDASVSLILESKRLETAKSLDVTVTWAQDLTWDEIYPKVLGLNRPEVILWYCGAYGLKQGSVDYYRDPISQLTNGGTGCRVNLFDLTAWGAFKRRGSLAGVNRCARKINELSIPWLRAIYSSSVFQQFCKINDPDTLDYVHKKVLQRAFIHNASTEFDDNHITIAEVFKSKCPLLEPVYKMDTSKSYSAIQYLEAMVLIEQLVQERIAEKDSIDIVFALPNDEAKYYRGSGDELDCLSEDVTQYLQLRFGKALQDRKITIHFLNFQYGEEPFQRPYNARGKVVKTISLQQIISTKGDKIMSTLSAPSAERSLPSGSGAASSSSSAVTPLVSIPAKVPGFGNYKPQEQILFAIWKQALSYQYELNGFSPLEVPPFVRKEFLERKGGIQHEIYAVSRLHGNDPTRFGIAFDRTVPFALYVRDHKSELVFPYKRYDISMSYRGESPAPGRFRGFYQCDVDVVGPNLALTNDVQCISALIDGLTSLLSSGIKDPSQRGFNMYLNHISVPKALFASASVPEEKVEAAMRIVDKMDKVGKEEVCKDLCALLSPEVDEATIASLVETFSYKGPIGDFELPEGLSPKAAEGFEALNQIIGSLIENGVTEEFLQFCPGMVRGLNYYTGVVFETFLQALPRKAGSVMSGGRYDELVDCFTENAKGVARKTGIEGVGGSIGLTRLFDVLSRHKLITPTQKTACKVTVLTLGKTSAISWRMSKAMREAQIPCDVYTGNSGKIGRELTYASRVGVPVSVMIMGDHAFCIKNMITGEQIKDLDTIEKCVAEARRILS